MKNMVKSSPLQTSNKLTNHSTRKTVVKKLRKGGASRSAINEITGHSNERGLDPYDSGEELQQRQMSHAIDQPSSSAKKQTSKLSKTFTRDTLPERNFSLFLKKYTEGINYNFVNCHVSIVGQDANKSVAITERKKR